MKRGVQLSRCWWRPMGSAASWGVVAALGLLGTARLAAETANRIIAIVNDDVITQADVALHVSMLLEHQEQSPESSGATAGQMQEAVLQRLIEQRLMLQEAKRLGISVNLDDVAQRFEGLRSQFESEEAFRQSLSDSGFSEVQMKEKVRDQLMVQRVIDAKIRSTIAVSPQEVARELSAHPELSKPGDRVRASHILIRVAEGRTEAQARALIQDLSQQLTKGADFASLAKHYSEDPHAEEGGLMEWVAQGELLPELDAALFHLKIGDISQPIQTRLGFHLVKVEERRSASDLSLMEANRAIYQQLYQRKFQEAFGRWLGELKRRAYIHILSPESSESS